ncbi:acyltransferase family protein [Jannaschia sp. R86511]|uniref:acyltransferase family protein n=1 Tax=Jannaschia sp. R86511 TaxID=3093853 RepID=UPI0036D2271E
MSATTVLPARPARESVPTRPGFRARAAALDAATPAGRDRFVDLVRLVSLVVVVAAHWVLVPLVADGTDVVGRSPWARAATWLLMVMPLFFAVGGYVHLRTLGPAHGPAATTFVVARAERLLGPVVVLLAVWLGLAAAVDTVPLGGLTDPVAVAVDRATTPLWFVAVYLVVVLLAPLTVRLHRRHGLRAVAGGVVLVAALDAARAHGPAWSQPVAVVASLLGVWLVVHQLGHLWGDGVLDRRRARALLALTGWGSALLLTVGTGWYPVDMQGLPGSEASSFTPPTLALLAQGAGLLGTVLLLREPATRLLHRPAVWAVVATGGAVMMTVFCWHLSAAFAVWGVLLLAGPVLPAVPAAATPLWWALVPVWLLVCLPVLVVLVRVARPAERWRVLRGDGRGAERRVAPVAVVAGTGLVAVATYAVSQLGVDGWTDGATEPLLGAALPVWPALLALMVGVLLLRGRGRQ